MDFLNVFLLIITLSFFEIILSLDNAVALSSIVDGLEAEDKKVALNIGMLLSYVFRIVLIFAAGLIIKYWQLKLVAAAYLVYLVYGYFSGGEEEDSEAAKSTLLGAIVSVTITDLAFSFDSVSTAVGISDRFIVICVGCGIGVLALRFLAELFQVWMKTFSRLELSGYLAISFVAFKLLAEIVFPDFAISELVEVGIVICIFAFGFSARCQEESKTSNTASRLI